MYSELQGAYGRDAYYRPKRYRPRELLSPLAAPHLRVEGREYPVLDLSSNGAALLVPLHESWPLEAAVEGQLMLHGLEAQRVQARVVRAEHGPRGVRIGLGLTYGFFDLEAVRRLDSHAHLELALTMGPLSRHATVPVALREAIAEAVHVVQYYKQILEPHEADARARGEQAVCELSARAYDGLSAHYTELRERASAAAEPILGDARVMQAAKAYTETVLTPLLLGSPMVARAYQKPLGYPGDYRVMLHYYANAYEGETAFAKLFHKLFVNHPLSAGVCTRKDYVVQRMEHELARHRAAADGETFFVTSLGCGPAMEVSSFVQGSPQATDAIRWRLIDQEPQTLQVAYEGAQRALATSSVRGVVECLNLSFGQLLKKPQMLEHGGPQSFIYSTGLFDYLSTRTAQQLLSALYACLKPGGELLVGNAKGPNRYFFCPEFVLDWSLIYRSAAEMHDLTAGLPTDAHVELDLEPGGAYWFLRVRKG